MSELVFANDPFTSALTDRKSHSESRFIYDTRTERFYQPTEWGPNISIPRLQVERAILLHNRNCDRTHAATVSAAVSANSSVRDILDEDEDDDENSSTVSVFVSELRTALISSGGDWEAFLADIIDTSSHHDIGNRQSINSRKRNNDSIEEDVSSNSKSDPDSENREVEADSLGVGIPTSVKEHHKGKTTTKGKIIRGDSTRTSTGTSSTWKPIGRAEFEQIQKTTTSFLDPYDRYGSVYDGD
ncbi:uncharacterized protein I303_107961 [Kwoniella dejecticola CBS 10117]|uniref:Uncharacterized protein n=1 Tax=Kwoniella dejecticola CBS 10117 TaxID=1296121 RepID=A0A1A5ZW56_9TREE|nr:uncharacterized protein I303_07954 [Kwoniella dejecticola CBS 10117]OBR82040.1 hypothetical protein I303_07954 [Kwoniella dejecticola CBS 10117]